MVYPYRESTKEYGVKPSDNDQEDKVRKKRTILAFWSQRNQNREQSRVSQPSELQGRSNNISRVAGAERRERIQVSDNQRICRSFELD